MIRFFVDVGFSAVQCSSICTHNGRTRALGCGHADKGRSNREGWWELYYSGDGDTNRCDSNGGWMEPALTRDIFKSIIVVSYWVCMSLCKCDFDGYCRTLDNFKRLAKLFWMMKHCAVWHTKPRGVKLFGDMPLSSAWWTAGPASHSVSPRNGNSLPNKDTMAVHAPHPTPFTQLLFGCTRLHIWLSGHFHRRGPQVQ